MNLFLTGYTGNLGYEIASRLTGNVVHALVRDPAGATAQSHVRIEPGDLENLPWHLAGSIEVIVHAAADTSFLAPLEKLRRTNVEGTERMLAFAARCPRLKKFVHISTACVCGRRSGDIPETRLSRPDSFVNTYEQSKWEAEERVFESGLPVEILRLPIVAGSEKDGGVLRQGALHHTLFWLWKGLIPMMPGSGLAQVDLISTEQAAAAVSQCALSECSPLRVIHVCAGESAPQLGELLEHVREVFARLSPAWQRGSINLPMTVDAETFALFEQTVEQSGDLLFRRVCRDSKAFLPGLLHPRRYLTASPVAAAGDWKPLAELVTRHVIDSKS